MTRRVAVIVLAALLWVGGGPARADQTIVHDGPPGAPQVSLIGDSTLTGVRWYADYGALERFSFVFSAESCRRTIEQSCISREGYRSANVIAAMRTLDGQLGDVLVVMSGYNDPLWTIDEAIDGVLAEARRQEVDHVVWLTLRTSPDVDYSDPQEQSSINTFRAYNEQLVDAAAASDGLLQIADWATYSHGASGWFEGDGVHLTPRGVDALTQFLTVTIERVLAGEDVSPAAAPWTVLVPGAEGDDVTAVQQALIDVGIDVPGGADGVYGNDTMAAVAEYQRSIDGLQVTGAVDMATARALGIVDDPSAAAEAEPSARGLTGGATPAGPRGAVDGLSAAGDGSDAGGINMWSVVAVAGVLAALVLAAVTRHRYVVAQRRARRWARVHPATSPHRSVADLRRAGRLPVSVPPGEHDVDDRAADDRGIDDRAADDRAADDRAAEPTTTR